MLHTLHERVFAQNALDPASISNGATGTGNIIDTQGAHSVMWLIPAPAAIGTSYTYLLEDSPNSNMSSATTVSTATVTAGASENSKCKRIIDSREVGRQRYNRLKITNNHSGAVIYAAVVVLGPMEPPITVPKTAESTDVVIND